MKHQNIPWDPISAHMKGEASEEQRKQIQEWLDQSPDHRAILDEIVNTWHLTKNKTEFYLPDLEQNWKKLVKRIDRSRERKIIPLFLRWSVAAAVLCVVFLSGLGLGEMLFTKQAALAYTKIIAPEGSKTQIVLPDSTHVWLNAGSVIEYPSDFTTQNRKVIMKGECFFDVTHDSKHPFVVRGSEFQVKVYGTRFNVHEEDNRNSADVALVSGKVTVLGLNNKEIAELNPGEQFVLTQGRGYIRTAKNMDALTAWMNNMLVFDNQSFEEIIPYLEKWYGVRIKLEYSHYYRHNYTFRVKTESLREVLDLISVITPIDYRIEGDSVTIKYKKRMK